MGFELKQHLLPPVNFVAELQYKLMAKNIFE